MSILNRFKPLVSPVCRGGALLEQTSVFRRVCSGSKAACHSLSSLRCYKADLASCHLSTYYFNSKRWYSELHSESSNSQKSTDVTEEESQVEESDVSTHLSKRSSETFNLDVLVSLLRQENAVDVCVIKVPEQIKYAEYFIVVSGISPRHLRAMAFYAIKVYKFLKTNHDPHVKIEGKDADDWMCVDFGSMVVHFMLPETRELYELEKLWTLRSYDEQLKSIPAEKLPEDFIYDVEVTKD
ncbi:mitochondrial assembly of ribosomal large subunit protein 1 [Scomber scombrus]|uniref:mitochondrial assembly of ribosomal large subunit protein 1 n=1 Tax=Scomber scombrus TaxID=13677 RepID=UPI002DD9E598|nr:mitochondrial assembly of ribosomal large subunit protein 1 [Scomber scombrus]